MALRNFVRAWFLAVLALAILAVPAQAGRHEPHRYAPRSGHCRKGYRELRRHHKVFCVEKEARAGKKIRASAPPSSAASEAPGGGSTPPIQTATALNATYRPLTTSRVDEAEWVEGYDCAPGCNPSGPGSEGPVLIGTVTLEGAVSPFGTPPSSSCGADPDCLPFALGAGGSGQQDVFAWVRFGAQERPEAVSGVRLGDLDEGGAFLPAVAIESGALHFHASSGSPAGYLASEAIAPIRFTPLVTETVEVEYVPCVTAAASGPVSASWGC